MFKNFLKVAWRNLERDKLFSSINVLGLGLGLACSLIIFLWVKDEFSFDGFQVSRDRLFKIIVNDVDKQGDITNSFDATPGRLAEVIKKSIPEIEYTSTVLWDNELLLSAGEKITKQHGRYASPDFFSMFSFTLLQGDAGTTLSSIDDIVISKKLADIFFKNETAIGKTIRVDNKRDYKVSGVFADIPDNSSLTFDFMLPIKNVFDENPWMVAGWGHFGPPTFIQLRKDASPEKVNSKIRHFLNQQDKTVDDKVLTLQPYKDMYLYSRFTKGIPDGGRIEYVRLFSIVAIFILLVACINFMNLATARSVKRAKEVGVRKAVGALRSLLFGQFVGEAILTALISLLVAIVLVILFLPMFNSLTGKHLHLPLGDPSFIIGLLALTCIVGFMAGLYPAMFLSALNPIKILKGSLIFKINNVLLRKGLVVFQFALSTFLIICTIIVYRQMQYVQSKNLGLDRENIVYVALEGDLYAQYEIFKHDMLLSGDVVDITKASAFPTNVGMMTEDIVWPGKDLTKKTGLWDMSVGYDFIKTMKIQLAEGRDFSPSYGEDTSNYLINERAAAIMKLDHPIGAEVVYRSKKGKIIGVMKDFHIHSLHENMGPLFITYQKPSQQWTVAIIRTRAGNIKTSLADLAATWKKLNPKYPFNYKFADDLFNQQYHNEMIVEKLADIFAFLAIFISSMGLFGLSMFMIEQRKREISIRKTLGASVTHIVAMLSGDFIKLVLIGVVIAFPLGWWVMNNWLSDFVFRIDIGWVVFLMAGALAIAIALVTISFQAINAAFASPVKSLRNE